MDKDFGTTDEIELENWLDPELKYSGHTTPPEMDETDQLDD